MDFNDRTVFLNILHNYEEVIMSRRDRKSNKRTKCALDTCRKEPFKKIDGYLYKGIYYCSKGHARKARKNEK